MKKITAILLAFTLLIPVLTVVGAASGDPTIRNGDFSALKNGLPAHWEVNSYEPEGYSVSASDGIVTLTNHVGNDLRLFQKVKVKENTIYTLRAEIASGNVRGGRGATLSIDNYAIDGTCLYSESVSGNADWREIRLDFSTRKGQTSIIVALRLGGYSEVSLGTAYFRNLTLETSDGSGGRVQSLQAWGANSGVSGEKTEAERIRLKSVLHLFLLVFVITAVVLLFGVYRNRERLGSRTIGQKRYELVFLLMVAAGIALRFFLCTRWEGHDTDMSCWIGWGGYIAEHGMSTFYTAPGHEWYDYPPFYMMVIGLITKILSVLGISAESGFGLFAYMLPATIADVACALLLARLAEKRGFSRAWKLLLAALVIFNPAIVMLSGVWGQIDSLLTLFLLLSFTELTKERRILAGAIYGLAVMTKWQALIYGPVLAFAYLLSIKDLRGAFKTVLAVLSALAVMLLVSLPFRGTQGLLWVVSRFLNSVSGYDYASVEAYNFLALVNGNWANASLPIFPGISYRMFGVVMIVLAVIVSLVYLSRKGMDGLRRGSSLSESCPEAVFLGAGFCMFMIFTFGHYMHERYVFPVILLLLFAFVYSRRNEYLFWSLALSSVLFLNEMSAMYVISELASSVVRSGREHNAVVRVCSLAETITFIGFAVSFVRGNIGREEGREI